MHYIITNQSIFIYIISYTNTESAKEGKDHLMPPITEVPTCELYSQPPSHESILKKCVSELKITLLFYLFLIFVIIFVDCIVLFVLI